MIEIHRCQSGEIEAIMAFINLHWRPGHVLGCNRRLMDWQHREKDGSYAYLGAWRGDELVGVLGYIPSRRYDSALADDNVIWMALWKVREGVGIAGLGLRMLNMLASVEPNVAIAVNGINPAHLAMYRAMRWQVGELRQFYTVDPEVSPVLIANTSGMVLPHPAKGNATFTEMHEAELRRLEPADFALAVPRKSPRGFIARFLEHPFYCYRIHGIQASGCGPALLTTRVVEHAGRRALRLIDFHGDANALADSGSSILRLMRSSGAEYADFCQYGIPEEVLTAAGFQSAALDGSVNVPTYFEPFVPKPGRIFCAIKARCPSPVVICRADGDQDRPSLLPEAAG